MNEKPFSFLSYESPSWDSGKLKLCLSKKLYFALNGITTFSTKLIMMSGYIGVLVFISGLVYSVFTPVQFTKDKAISGWAFLLLTAFIVGGIQLLAFKNTEGVQGPYI